MKLKKNFLNHSKKRYQNNLEKMEGSKFVFDCVHLFHYKCHEINPNCGISYIDFCDYIKNKKVTINPINKKDNNCLQYTITAH